MAQHMQHQQANAAAGRGQAAVGTHMGFSRWRMVGQWRTSPSGDSIPARGGGRRTPGCEQPAWCSLRCSLKMPLRPLPVRCQGAPPPKPPQPHPTPAPTPRPAPPVLCLPSKSGLEVAWRELTGRSGPMARRSGECGEGVGTAVPVDCLSPPLAGLVALLPTAPFASSAPSLDESAVDSKGLGTKDAPTGACCACSDSARGEFAAEEPGEPVSSSTMGRWCSG